MAWFNPFSWFSSTPIDGYEDALAEIQDLPAELGVAYRNMAKILVDLAEARDRCVQATASLEDEDLLRAKNFILYGDPVKRWIFGAPPGEDGTQRHVNTDELQAVGFSADQAEDLTRLAKNYRLAALEWDRQAAAGEISTIVREP